MAVDGGLLKIAGEKIADLDRPAYVKDCELRHVAVNQAYARFFGRKPEDFLGRTSTELFGRAEDADWEDRERRALVFGEEEWAFCFDASGGRRCKVAVERFLTEDDEVFVFGAFAEAPADLTAQAKPRHRREAVEGDAAGPDRELLSLIVEELPAPVFLRDREHRMVIANKAYRKLSNLASEDLIGRTELETFGARSDGFRARNDDILKTGAALVAEEAVPVRGGGKVPVLSQRCRIEDRHGNHYLLGSHTDISALREREAELDRLQSEVYALKSHVDSLLRSMPVGVLLLDHDFVIEYANDAFHVLWAADPSFEIIGRGYFDLVVHTHELGLYGQEAADPLEACRQRKRELEERGLVAWHIERPDGRSLSVKGKALDDGRFLITYSDVSTLRERERESVLYRAAIEQLPVPVFIRDDQFRLVFANAAYERMFAKKREELYGRLPAEIFPRNREQLNTQYEQVLSTGERIEQELDFFVEDMPPIAAINRLNRITAPDGSYHLVGSIADVTALAAREKELRAARAEAEKLNAYLEGVMRTMPVGVMVLSEDLVIEFANERVYETWDLSYDQPLEGVSFRDFSKRNYEHGWTWSLDESFEKNYRQRVEELRNLTGVVQREMGGADGKSVTVTSKRLIDNKILITYVNMSEIRKREREINEARAQLERIGELMQDSTRVMSQGLAVIEDGRIIQSNQALARILNVTEEMLAAGESWKTCVAHCAERGDFGEDPQVLVGEWQAKIRATQGFSTTFLAAGRTWVQMETTVSGRGHWMIVCTDITEMKEREEELEALLSRAETADRAKSEFLANMSHEIRTPMNGVLGMAELLSKSLLDSRQKTFVDIIVKSGNALLTIINDILDFSKIDAGQLKLRKAPFDPVEAIEDVASLLSTAAAEKDIELIVRGDATVRHMLVGDAGRFRQIVTNLVGNAIKFTEKGHVLINLVGEISDADTMFLSVRIEDTGIGIPEAMRRSIFEKFSQVDTSSTRRHEGTGLGLAITAGLVDLFGGHIEVESEVGRGSVFTLHMPFPIAHDRQRQQTVPMIVQDARVMVIDDNAVNRQILSEQLGQWGFDGVAVEGGRSALAVLNEAARIGVKIDVLVIDYHMPEMNGIDVARLVRKDHRFDDIAIIFLTSMDMVGDENIFHELNVQAHLMKPARANLLRNAIIDVVRTNRLKRGQAAAIPAPAVEQAEPVAAAPAQQPAMAMPQSTLDILVAEDNDVNQIVFTQILEATNLSFKIVGNGKQAVEAWEACNPRLILMDVSMPVMNGHQAAQAIRAKEDASGGGRRVPIVGVTAHAMESDREACLAAGMDDYLSKPISPELLEQKVSQWLGEGSPSMRGTAV